MKNILVTGGAGFIGSNFIRYTLENESGVKIVNYDSLTYAGNLDNLADLPDRDRYQFIRGDICDGGHLDQVLQKYQINLVIHFAAETHVDRSTLNPEIFHQTNFNGTLTLLEAFRKYYLAVDESRRIDLHFHHISTDEIYGSLEREGEPFSENSLEKPNSIYAASKAASDVLVRSYFHAYGLPITITNCSNNYGPNQHPEKLVPLIILNAMAGKPLPIYGDGLQIRDWIFIKDHCRAIWKVIREGALGQVYLVAGTNQSTNLEIVREICRLLDERFPESEYFPHYKLALHVKDRPGHDRRYALNTGKISTELGWKPDVKLREGLEKTINWYLKHPEWVQNVQNQPNYQQWLEDNYLGRDTY